MGESGEETSVAVRKGLCRQLGQHGVRLCLETRSVFGRRIYCCLEDGEGELRLLKLFENGGLVL